MDARDSCSCFLVISRNCVYFARGELFRAITDDPHIYFEAGRRREGWVKLRRKGKTRKLKEAGTNNNYIRRLRKKKCLFASSCLHLTRETLCIWLKANAFEHGVVLYNEGVAKYFFSALCIALSCRIVSQNKDKNLCLGLCCLSSKIQSLFLSSSF